MPPEAALHNRAMAAHLLKTPSGGGISPCFPHYILSNKNWTTVHRRVGHIYSFFLFFSP
jgi:hypothetical protein